ncbi:MAG: hypothetical protein U0O03_02265 [Blautia wexlerae]
MKYIIREMMKELTGLTDLQWGGYAFYHEPLERKFTPEQKENYTRLANKCGEEEAESLLSEYPEKSIEEISRNLGFTVKTPDTPIGGGHVLFAQYVEPKEITVFMDCIEKAEKLITKEKLQGFFPAADLKDVLMAHELFHGIEYRKRKQIFTQTEKIELWRRPFSNKSKILCLSEMAAMAFAKRMTGISCSPYVLDVLLMYCYNEEAAIALYEEILEAAGIREREEEC